MVDEILKSIRISKHKEVYRQMMITDFYLCLSMHNNILYNKNNGHIGGGKIEKYNVEFENNTFIIYHNKSKAGHDISIKRYNDEKSSEYCLHIQISNIDDIGIAIISNISYYKECVYDKNDLSCKTKTYIGLRNPRGGSILLRLAIKFLRNQKEILKINKIRLMDNSIYQCNNNRLSLSLLHTLMHGDTWYGKYGFRPYDTINNIIDKELLKKYENNKKIVTETKIKDTNMRKYIKQILESKYPNDVKEQKRKYDNMIDNTKNMSIADFFKIYIKKYDNNCSDIGKFYNEFAIDMKIERFHQRTFALFI